MLKQRLQNSTYFKWVPPPFETPIKVFRKQFHNLNNIFNESHLLIEEAAQSKSFVHSTSNYM